MKKFSRSVLTLGLTTSIMLEGLLLADTHQAVAATSPNIRQLTTHKTTNLKLFTASEVTDSTVQLATGVSQTSAEFAGSLQDILNHSEA